MTADLRLPPGTAALRNLAPAVAETVRRVVQESLTNVVRHARPAHAVVAVEIVRGEVRVSVTGDGRRDDSHRDDGRRAETGTGGGGRGVAGMRERVARRGRRLAGDGPDSTQGAVVIRVLLADDEELMRAGLRMMLHTQPDLTVVGEAGDGGEAVRLAGARRPDVVLMDIRMPVLDGVAATRAIADQATDGAGAPPKVLILTTFELDEYVFAAIRAGASGFLLKRSPPETLIAGIRTLAAGEALLGPSVTRRLLAEFARSAPVVAPPEVARRLARLTERERDVLPLLARALSNAEIAARLHIGEATVKTHVGRVLDKLGLRDRVHAAVFAFDHKLVRPGEGPVAGA